MRPLIVRQLDYDLTPVAAIALAAHTAVQPVFLHLGLHRRNVEDLVTHRLALHAHRNSPTTTRNDQ